MQRSAAALKRKPLSCAERCRRYRWRLKRERPEEYQRQLREGRIRSRFWRRDRRSQRLFDVGHAYGELYEWVGADPSGKPADAHTAFRQNSRVVRGLFNHPVQYAYSDSGTPQREPEKPQMVRKWRTPTSIGELLPKGLAELLGQRAPPNAKRDELRAALEHPRELLRTLALEPSTGRAVLRLLELSGCYDWARNRRNLVAADLVRRHGSAATGILLLALVDIASDDKVSNVGAVLVKRLPHLLRDNWRLGLSAGAPDNIRDAFGLSSFS